MSKKELFEITNLSKPKFLSNDGWFEIEYYGEFFRCYLGNTGITFTDEGLPSYEEDTLCEDCGEFLFHCRCAEKKILTPKERIDFDQKRRQRIIGEIVNTDEQTNVDLNTEMARAIVKRLENMRRKIFRKQRQEKKYSGTPARVIYLRTRECEGCKKLIPLEETKGNPWYCPHCGVGNKRSHSYI
jgi:hypothetical protein